MRTLIALCVCLVFSSTQLFAQKSEVVGRYRSVDLGLIVVTIDIRPDGTFSYSSHGDLENTDLTGKWRLAGPGLVLANSDGKPPVSTLRSSVERHPGTVLVVTDDVGGVLPGASVRTTCRGVRQEFRTDERGEVHLPESAGCLVTADLQGFEPLGQTILEAPSNHHTVVLAIPRFFLKDALWLIHDQKLYELHYGYPKVTKTR